ncbi:MAG TPA: hypothetical protein VFW84_12575 [Aquabacterium sp.]|uniref:hypothetical protein n=1 Tax=Aquabacterium sp. TaxID=1872578 RepID=UPI002E3490A7|nr:hypothetical protein [Aquabacterium sp.]HEX5373558.1 hypothetical protein [Aquabacterium sp.]
MIKLNRSEQANLVAEGPMGPINVPYLLRFDRPVDTDLLRQSLWDLMMAQPRLRAVLSPGWFTYQLEVLDDEFLLRQLFDVAFSVWTGVPMDTPAHTEAAHTQELNTPISLQRNLPWRAVYDPRPEQPVLIFNVHHVMADGATMGFLTQALLARLQGQAMSPSPIESPSQRLGLWPRRPWQWPGMVWALVQAHRRDARRAKGARIVTLQTRHYPRFSHAKVHHAELPCTLTQFKAAAKAANTTVNTLLTACLAQIFLAPHRQDPKAQAVLRIAVDLRKYFPEGHAPRMGNFVVNMVIRAGHESSLADQIKSIHEQITDHLARFERHERAIPYLLLAGLPFIGLRLMSKLLQSMRASGGLAKTTCFLTNLGSADVLQPKGDGPRLTELRPLSVGPSFFMAASSLADKMFLTLCHQHVDFDQGTIDEFLVALQQQVQSLPR